MAKVADMLADPTLEALDREIEKAGNDERIRPYFGASSVGHPCEKKLWLGWRWTVKRRIPAKGLRAIEDGHRGELLMAARLRAVPGLTLWTMDEDTGRQVQSWMRAG